MTLTVLFSVAVLLVVARAFNGPALSALAPNLVPKEVLPNAIALSSIAWQTGMIVGPAIGGYASAWMPPAAYIASALLLVFAFIRLPFIGPVPRRPLDPTPHPIHPNVPGAQYFWRHNPVPGP